MTKGFHSIHTHGFVRAAVCTPAVLPGDPDFNAAETLRMARQGDVEGCDLMLFPELGLSAYAIDDLFLQDALLKRAEAEIAVLADATRALKPVLVVGAPVICNGRLYNCAIAISRGRILGVTPKSFLPNYREYYEKRWFAPGAGVTGLEVRLAGQTVPFGADLAVRGRRSSGFHLSPRDLRGLLGAAAALDRQRHGRRPDPLQPVGLQHRGRQGGRPRSVVRQPVHALPGGLPLFGRGSGESTTDLAWDGQASIHELGRRLAQTDRFPGGSAMAVADIDVGRLRLERMRTPTFNDAAAAAGHPERRFRRVRFAHQPHFDDVGLVRPLDRFPFVPDDPARLDKDCYEAFNIQVQGLVKRIRATKSKHIVIGVSGGLDSTHALIVAAKAFDAVGLPRANILGFTMPGFATSEGTRSNAWALMNGLGVTGAEIDIRPTARLMLEEMGHPFAGGEPVYDIAFENVQAGLRTDYLFRLANQRAGFVLGTGDLSELALGWCTYGVGDQMSHYNVNGGVAKTLIQHLIRWVVKTGQFDEAANATLLSVLGTEISPELVPADATGAIQSTQAKVGPYELQDFNLFHITRFGLAPSKVAFLAWHAWRDVARGEWPENFPDEARNAYDLATIKKWLGVFLFRFFEISQFKRSAMPNGPKVISGGALSPRGDWRAPSDGTAKVWLEELEAGVP